MNRYTPIWMFLMVISWIPTSAGYLFTFIAWPLAWGVMLLYVTSANLRSWASHFRYSLPNKKGLERDRWSYPDSTLMAGSGSPPSE